MAISITQQPTTPNAAYTSLLYVISGSTTTGNPQYSYVMDIYESGSTTRLNRITQVPNPDGVATFDVSRVLQSKLSYDNYWKTLGSIDEVNSVKTFDIKFGEQYGTSISSSITVYPDLTSHSLEVFPAVVDPNNGSSYNFNTSSYTQTGSNFLTNFPGSGKGSGENLPYPNGYPYIVDSSDYMTVTAFNEDFLTPSVIGVSGYFIETGSYVNPIGNALWSVSLTGSNNSYFSTYGVGPRNISRIDATASASIASGATNMLFTTNDHGGIVIAINNNWDGSFGLGNNSTPPANFDLVWDFGKTVQPRGTEYTRFAFINKLGFYDYYNVYSPLKRDSSLSRNLVSLPKVDYSNIVSTYSVENGGDTSYYTDISDNYSITTQYLDKDIANWLEELLESPEVFIQQGDDFVPIVITDSSYTSNQSTARNKLFQYTINFKPSNGRDLVSRETNCPPSPPPYVPPTPPGPVTTNLVLEVTSSVELSFERLAIYDNILIDPFTTLASRTGAFSGSFELTGSYNFTDNGGNNALYSYTQGPWTTGSTILYDFENYVNGSLINTGSGSTGETTPGTWHFPLTPIGDYSSANEVKQIIHVQLSGSLP